MILCSPHYCRITGLIFHHLNEFTAASRILKKSFCERVLSSLCNFIVYNYPVGLLVKMYVNCIWIKWNIPLYNYVKFLAVFRNIFFTIMGCLSYNLLVYITITLRLFLYCVKRNPVIILLSNCVKKVKQSLVPTIYDEEMILFKHIKSFFCV